MRIVFMGSGVIAGPTLQRLLEHPAVEIAVVVTQPDRPKGRGLRLAACPVKEIAAAIGLPVLTPEKVGAEASVHEIEALHPDLVVVAAYGQYIKPAILELPRHGAINFHPSLLPKYRGAAPIQMAIANGETVTGVSIIDVAREMDAGDILLQEPVPIESDDTAGSLMPRLAEVGAVLMVRAVDRILDGSVTRTPQDPTVATYVSKLTKEEGRIDWRLGAEQIRNRVRGFNPWPACFCEITAGSNHWVKVWAVRVEPGEGIPGTILETGHEGPLIATGSAALRLQELQPPGKKPMTGAAFLNGHPLSVGDRLG